MTPSTLILLGTVAIGTWIILRLDNRDRNRRSAQECAVLAQYNVHIAAHTEQLDKHRKALLYYGSTMQRFTEEMRKHRCADTPLQNRPNSKRGIENGEALDDKDALPPFTIGDDPYGLFSKDD